MSCAVYVSIFVCDTHHGNSIGLCTMMKQNVNDVCVSLLSCLVKWCVPILQKTHTATHTQVCKQNVIVDKNYMCKQEIPRE